MTKFGKKNKAISPIIATLILIVKRSIIVVPLSVKEQGNRQ